MYDTYTRVVLDIVHLNSKDQFATLHTGRFGSGIAGVILARRLANPYRNNLSVAAGWWRVSGKNQFAQ